MVGSSCECIWEHGEAVSERRETDKALFMSLAMVCKNEAHERGFESWRKLCKEYGSTTGTSLHEYSNLLEYDFRTTDGFKKKLLKWDNQIFDFHQVICSVTDWNVRMCCRGLQDPSGRICEFRIEVITQLFEWH